MFKEERLQLILDSTNRERKASFTALSKLCRVSEDTIRRDIKELAEQGLLKAVRGGAIAHSPIPHHYRDREKHIVHEKVVIANKAQSFLKDGQVVIFDGGTSAVEVARHLDRALRITAVTNSFPVASLLEDHPSAEVIFLGGRLDKPSFTTRGYDTAKALEEIRADVCLLGVCSIHQRLGLTVMDYEDAQLKKVMAANSEKVFALANLEKINTAENYFVCPVGTLDTIITEVEPSHEKLKTYQKMGINIA
ncbi:DeoR family transcriptional regulator [Pontibacter ummariensis]|uniref:Transcriptional regulator, DeoR family n=1 Tax=Pontibacter ummariensis TaxID=1610492 RepID=A0A239KTQ9_9BACT|nr:DeoR/GlpR family DNA-binding transcription regulator [Pontibacter ummariensis]PRY05032.1 DeoR family transcriptional regulator [Pontibacter ummariensis]SNT21445.1 transcriptional regulator, DeoR family [Pontibacter ummariensis]